MPRGKYSRKNKCNESALTTRLIQISMKTDDHIYNNKLVTAVEAAAYLQEIATLKLRSSSTNARALQVIEKLTRLMSGILTEDGTIYASSSRNTTFHTSNEYARSASPVYSLPDEDRILSSSAHNDDENLRITHVDEDVTEKEMTAHNDDENLRITHVDEDVTEKEMNISHDHINTNKTSENRSQFQNGVDNMEVLEVIDITNDNDDGIEHVACPNDKDFAIEYVNTGISNMVIQDELSFQTPSNDLISSQSILENYDNDKTNIEIKEKERTKDIEMVSQKETDATLRITKNAKDHFQILVPSQATIASPESIVSQPTIKDSGVKSKSDLFSVSQENTVKKRKKVSNRNDSKIKRPKSKNIRHKKIVNSAEILQTAPNTTSISKPSCRNYYNDKENKPKTIKEPQDLKNVHKIYNDNVENDLSWVENIRYIREISLSEYDPALTILPENFWDNFTLPGTWDDLDFEV